MGRSEASEYHVHGVWYRQGKHLQSKEQSQSLSGRDLFASDSDQHLV